MICSNLPHTFFVSLLVFLSILLLFAGCSSTRVITPARSEVTLSSAAININSANAASLEELPNIGPNLAKKIVEHRERFGRFRKPEHLLMIEGVSDKRFQEIKHLVKVE